MNKKLIISLTTIAAIAIIVIGATTAYYSNTETSSSNTFIAGAIDLKVDNECHLNGRVCINEGQGYFWQGTSDPCDCTWQLMDLDGKAIFSFLDVKPGDDGEDTISLHVDSNPAWVCAEVSNVTQTENGCNTPEAKVDTTCDNPGLNQGELWNNLTFSIWMDKDCDNVYDTEDAPYLVENAKATDLKWPIADSQTGSGPIRDACIGIAWSVPDAVGNIIQGDSVTGDITFNAYQARNNMSFLCNPPVNYCGDDNVDPGEECDGDEPQVCDATGGYKGIKTCNQCIWSSCEPTEWCGDNIVNDEEECDGSAPEHYSCTECKLVYQPYCGDNEIDPGEQCDDGNTNNDDGCSSACQSEPAYIVIHKDVVNNEVGTKSSSDFRMTLDNVLAAQDMQHNVGDTNVHVVSEQDAMGYVKTYSDDCDSNGNITAVWNQTKTCTVTNTMPYFTVTVTKDVDNINGGNNVIADFNLFVGSTQVTSGVSKKVAVGTYLINESGVGGYDGAFTGDCNPDTQLLTGASGDTKTCTITNIDIKPNITLIKQVVGGTALPSDFIMRVDGVPVPSGGSKLVTSNTGHTITEDVKTGYIGTISGDAKCPITLGGTATLNEGEAITCTITNTYNP